MADKLVERTGDRRWYMWFSGLVVLVSVPFALSVYLIGNPMMALLCLFPAIFIGHMFLGPVTAQVQNLSGVRRRAMGAAFYLFLSNLISMGLGPLIIGITSDLFSTEYGHDALRYSLVTLVTGSSLVAAVLFFFSSRTLREDLDYANAR